MDKVFLFDSDKQSFASGGRSNIENYCTLLRPSRALCLRVLQEEQTVAAVVRETFSCEKGKGIGDAQDGVPIKIP